MQNKMMNIRSILWLTLGWVLGACSADNELLDEQQLPERAPLTITTSVNDFEGAATTRTNLAGNAFVNNDWIKLKIICPFVANSLIGEYTWGSSDDLWLLKWGGSNWKPLDSSDKVDLYSQYYYSYNNVLGQYEAQQTPYIYTASTWNENVIFKIGSSRFSQYSYIFRADQSVDSIYRDNDLMWAQTYMQTGSYNVHLSFNHVMACLKITLSGVSFTNPPVVTLENMPDIDQQEVVVGDYYAAASKSSHNYGSYGNKGKCRCDKANNGKVLGVAEITDASTTAVIHPLTGGPSDTVRNTGSTVENTGVYTAYYDSGTSAYYLIVPPCNLDPNNTGDGNLKAKFMIRDGKNRYSYTLPRTTFEQGKLYPINIALTAPTNP